jgi:hypothetical protein
VPRPRTADQLRRHHRRSRRSAPKRRLLDICEAWLAEATVEGLPPGIFDLRNALQDESAWGDLD